MNQRQQDILQLLTIAPRTNRELARMLNAPRASVRRSIQRLRARGWYISHADITGGTYTLDPGQVARNVDDYTTDRDFGDEWGL